MKTDAAETTRSWIVIGLFVLTGYIVTLIAFVPSLEKNELFSTLATLIIGSGGLLASIAWYFASSRGSAVKDDTNSALASALVNLSPPAPAPATIPQPQPPTGETKP